MVRHRERSGFSIRTRGTLGTLSRASNTEERFANEVRRLRQVGLGGDINFLLGGVSPADAKRLARGARPRDILADTAAAVAGVDVPTSEVAQQLLVRQTLPSATQNFITGQFTSPNFSPQGLGFAPSPSMTATSGLSPLVIGAIVIGGLFLLGGNR